MSTYHVRCHCGAVQLDADLDLANLATCNCSICGRSGAIMAFVPAEKVTGIVGEEHLTDYTFASKRTHHAFCSICGMRPFARGEGKDGAAWAMVNARCVDGVDVHTLTITNQYDGKSL
jgi:hypothetical protein